MLGLSHFLRLVGAALVVTMLALPLAFPSPAAADDAPLRCNFGVEPDLNAQVSNPVFFSAAFSCFQNDTLVAAPEGRLFLDGQPIAFERRADNGTATLFATVTLAPGRHTGKVTVEGDGEFVWSFTVLAPGELPTTGERDRTPTALFALMAGMLLLTAGLSVRLRRVLTR